MHVLIGLSLTMFCGMCFKRLGFPALIGYLLAGFALHEYANVIKIKPEHLNLLSQMAHYGVLLLLFSIGLKIEIKKLISKHIIGSSLVQFVLGTASTLIFFKLFGWSLKEAFIASACLSFSSTVLAIKLLEERKELKAFHGKVVIGILIMQDLIALTLLSVFEGSKPALWSVLLLLLPLARPLIIRLLNWVGHEELLLMFGLLLGLLAGPMLFKSAGLSEELGALMMGVLLAPSQKSSELSKALWSLREIFLVAFFLTIGSKGFPDSNDWLMALGFLALLPLKAFMLFIGTSLFRLKARTSLLSSLMLANYSEFALILAAALMPKLLVPCALAVALSFVLASPINQLAHNVYEKSKVFLKKFERTGYHPDDYQVLQTEGVNILILGMGRVGLSAYREFEHLNKKVLGIDADTDMTKRLIEKGVNVRFADVEDNVFWDKLNLNTVEAVVICLNANDANCTAVSKLREKGFNGIITAHSLYEDHAAELLTLGANKTYLTMDEAGVGLATNTMDLIMENSIKSALD